MNDEEIVEFLQTKEMDELELSDHQLDYLFVRALPGVDLNIDTDVVKCIFRKKKAVKILETNTDEPYSGSGDTSIQTYGCFVLNGSTIYFVLIDDEGWSGYECCGYIGLDYCTSLEQLVNLGMTEKQKKAVWIIMYPPKPGENIEPKEEDSNYTLVDGSNRLQAF